jgi:hypothetical protein
MHECEITNAKDSVADPKMFCSDLDSAFALIFYLDLVPALALILDPDPGFGSGLFLKYIRVYFIFHEGSKNSLPIFKLQIK